MQRFSSNICIRFIDKIICLRDFWEDTQTGIQTDIKINNLSIPIMEYSCIMICGNKWTDWYGIRRTYFDVASENPIHVKTETYKCQDSDHTC
nr:unnamed protein product [Haemonchus contortus]